MKRYLKKIVFLVLLFFTIFFNSTAFAQVASQGVTVDVNVPAPSGGGGGGGGSKTETLQFLM